MNNIIIFTFDILLVALLVAMAWITCSSQNRQRAVSYFIGFGLLLALAWARLKAPDLALAEAIIGAGISGALLLAAIRDGAQKSEDQIAIPWWQHGLINLMTLLLALVLGWALWHGIQLSDGMRLSPAVMSQLDHTGVSNPVTAVLLNYRAYDTLLELAVVLTAVMALLTLNPMRSPYRSAEPVLQTMVSWLVPLLVITSGYLLWVGAHAPGGAFQAGALLASALILQQLVHSNSHQVITTSTLRLVLVLGIAVFALVGLAMMLLEHNFLDYREGYAGTLILLIETAATLSIASALALAYLGGRPDSWEREISS